MTISVNGIENSEQSVMILNTKQSGQTVAPDHISPILAQVLTVTLESTYPMTLDSPD